MNNQDLERLVKQNEALFWYIPERNKADISEDVLVEFVLNYGTYEACKDLLDTLGTEAVATVFFKHLQSERRRNNYFPEIIIYFTKYFHLHAPRSFERAAAAIL
jgi:hypothetical protein